MTMIPCQKVNFKSILTRFVGHIVSSVI